MNYSENGKEKLEKLNAKKQETIVFPVSYDLKAVMTISPGNEDENKEKLTKVLRQQKINFLYRDKKISSKGAYASFTFSITLESREQMQQLYADLKKIKGLKFAL